MAFLAIDGYFCIIENQNASSVSSALFILSPRLLERDADSFSSHIAKLEESLKFTKGLRIQSNSSTLIEGKYSSTLLPKHVKCSTMTGIISFMQVLRTNGNMSKLPAFILLFHKVTLFVKAINLSVEVRIFSFLPCMLLFSLLSCPNISVKYYNLDNHKSFLMYLQNRSCPSVPQKVRSSFWSSWTRDSTFPFDSNLTPVCNSKRTYWESISLHINSKILDFTVQVLMKFTNSITSLNTSFYSFCAIFATNTCVKNSEFAQ